MMASLTVLSLVLLVNCVVASPALLLDIVTNQTLVDTLQGVYGSISTSLEAQNFQDVIATLEGIEAADKPTSAQESIERLEQANSTQPPTLYHYIANLRALNLVDTISSLLNYAKDIAAGEHSSQNNNPDPSTSVYPQALSCDAPYTTPESDLRAAIYIPPNFTWGKKPPVILFPGTGGSGFTTFGGNFIPLLQNSDFADPVWVNVPGLLLDDAQVSAEYAAYSINYISAVSKQNVTLVGWSQGNINTQWAFKYWPSTREKVTNHIAVSPDYAGTIMANFISPEGLPMPASVLQQRYLQSSNFITTLRLDDGDSAYVPTTTIYSGLFDEIVEPQQGSGASAFLKDAREVGVTNNEVQLVCPGQPAGSFYTHEGVLYNPLAFALFRDAMKNGGPGRTSRLNVSTLCSQYLTPGLDVGDLLTTENAIAVAGLAILLHAKMPQEPPRMRYTESKPYQNLAACVAVGANSTASSSTSLLPGSTTTISDTTTMISSTRNSSTLTTMASYTNSTTVYSPSSLSNTEATTSRTTSRLPDSSTTVETSVVYSTTMLPSLTTPPEYSTPTIAATSYSVSDTVAASTLTTSALYSSSPATETQSPASSSQVASISTYPIKSLASPTISESSAYTTATSVSYGSSAADTATATASPRKYCTRGRSKARSLQAREKKLA